MTRPETLAGEKSLERWVLRRADHVLGNSTTVIEELRKFGVSPNKLGLIANGIDPSAFEDARSRCELRAALGWPAEAVVVLSLANLIPYKGRVDLFHALARSEEHTSELQSLMRISYAVFCL